MRARKLTTSPPRDASSIRSLRSSDKSHSGDVPLLVSSSGFGLPGCPLCGRASARPHLPHLDGGGDEAASPSHAGLRLTTLAVGETKQRRPGRHGLRFTGWRWGRRGGLPGHAGLPLPRSGGGAASGRTGRSAAEGAEFLPLRPECSARGRCRGCGPHCHVLAPRLPPLRPSIGSAASPHLDGGGDEGGSPGHAGLRFTALAVGETRSVASRGSCLSHGVGARPGIARTRGGVYEAVQLVSP